MIAAMKKYAFLVFHNEYDQFLEKLGKMGVLHVISRETGDQDEHLQDLEQKLRRTDRIMSMLSKYAPEDKTGGISIPGGEATLDMANRAEELDAAIVRLNSRRDEILKELHRIEPWGEFDRSDLEKFKEAGYRPFFYRCTDRRFNPCWEDLENLFIISRLRGCVWFMMLSETGEEPAIEAERIDPGEVSPGDLQEQLAKVERELEESRKELLTLSKALPPVLEREKSRLEGEISLSQVYRDTQKASADRLMILEGWVPEDARPALDQWLEKEDIVYVAIDPDEDDIPPVRLQNNRFSRLFEPISRLFDLPSYRELDLTPYFAPFFMIFFGFCLGDAGYGVFFILFATLFKRKAKKQLKPILTLTQYLGVATIIFGLLSGTFFGVNLIDSGYTLTSRSLADLENAGMPAGHVSEFLPLEGKYFRNRTDFLKSLEQTAGSEVVNEYRGEILRNAEAGIPLVGRFRHLMQDPQSMFYLSLLIGGVQIIFGITLRVFNVARQKGFMHSLPVIGWLILIMTLIFRYIGVFDGKYAGYLFYALLILSGIFIFVLNKPGAGVLSRLGSGIWDSYSMVTGVFGDLLSYIRLFALGISSAILGFVFNDISLQLLNVPYIGWLFFLLLLLIGHSINLFLATLGGFIHPMRLTFVEFYKNAGFKGGGKEYDPFVLNNQ